MNLNYSLKFNIYDVKNQLVDNLLFTKLPLKPRRIVNKIIHAMCLYDYEIYDSVLRVIHKSGRSIDYDILNTVKSENGDICYLIAGKVTRKLFVINIIDNAVRLKVNSKYGSIYIKPINNI